jgi:hypothetical protein
MFTGELLLDNITREWTGACTAQSGWNVNTVLIVDVFELRDLVNGPYDPSVDPDSALAWQFQTYDFISFHPDLTYNANIGDPATIDELFPNPEDIFGNGTHINSSPPADGVAHALTTYTYLTYYYLQDDLHGTKSSAGVFYVNLVEYEYSAVPMPINQHYTVAEDEGIVFLNFSSYDDNEGTQATTYCLAPDPEFRGNLYYIGDCAGY